MICKLCNLKEICKTYDLIKSIDYADIEVNTCDFNDNTITMHERHKEMPVNPKVVAQYQGKAKPDLKDLEKQINNVPDKPEPVKVECPSCKGTTYDDDIRICSKCGKKICSNCGTHFDSKDFCQECWEKE
jgi:hypothetical protein